MALSSERSTARMSDFAGESHHGGRASPRRLHERTVTCPHCWESITMLLDPSVQEQTYIEDCEVCCRPIRIHYAIQRGAVTRFDARPAT